MARLNLGCGDDIRPRDEGWINHNLWRHTPGVDVAWDLNNLPWPWEADSFMEIAAVSVLEHLEIDLLHSATECWRIIRAGGMLNIKFPLATSPFIRWDPTHRWIWAPESVDFLDPETRLGKIYHYYTKKKWKVASRRVGPKKRNCWVQLRPRGK